MLFIREGILATDKQCLVQHDPTHMVEPGMLFSSLNKHSSFAPEELLVVSFPSLFSLPGRISSWRDLRLL